jgi:hypothetical protein
MSYCRLIIKTFTESIIILESQPSLLFCLTKPLRTCEATEEIRSATSYGAQLVCIHDPTFYRLVDNCSFHLSVMIRRPQLAHMSIYAIAKWAFKWVIIALLILYATYPTTTLLNDRMNPTSRSIVFYQRPDISYEYYDLTDANEPHRRKVDKGLAKSLGGTIPNCPGTNSNITRTTAPMNGTWPIDSANKKTNANKPHRRECDELLFGLFFNCREKNTSQAVQKLPHGSKNPLIYIEFIKFLGFGNFNDQSVQNLHQETTEAKRSDETNASSCLSLIGSLNEKSHARRSGIIPRHRKRDKHNKNWKKSYCDNVERSIYGDEPDEEPYDESDDGIEEESNASLSKILPRECVCQDMLRNLKNQLDCTAVARSSSNRKPRRRNRIRRFETSLHSCEPGFKPSGRGSGRVLSSEAAHDGSDQDLAAQTARTLRSGLADLDIYPSHDEDILKHDPATRSTALKLVRSLGDEYDFESSICRAIRPKELDARLTRGMPGWCYKYLHTGWPLPPDCIETRMSWDVSNDDQDVDAEGDSLDSNISLRGVKKCPLGTPHFPEASDCIEDSAFQPRLKQDHYTRSELSFRFRKGCRYDLASKMWLCSPNTLNKRGAESSENTDNTGAATAASLTPVIAIPAGVVLLVVIGFAVYRCKRAGKEGKGKGSTKANYTSQLKITEPGFPQKCRLFKTPGGVSMSDGAQDEDIEAGDVAYGPDGVQDDWSRWILHKNGNDGKAQMPRRFSPIQRTRPPRIPSLTLPKPTFATVRNVSGLPDIESMAHENPVREGRGKAGLSIKWGSTV